MSSASTISAALVTMLGAASALGQSGVSNNYKVLETCSGCCAVISWVEVNTNHMTFGNPTAKDNIWTMHVHGFIKDTNDPVAVMERVIQFPDTIVDCINADDTLQGTVEKVNMIKGTRDPSQAVEAGGFVWLPMFFEIECEVWDG